MKLRLSELKRIIAEEWWSESYDHNLLDDDAFLSSSVLVPDETKRKISKWAVDMGLQHRAKRSND